MKKILLFYFILLISVLYKNSIAQTYNYQYNYKYSTSTFKKKDNQKEKQKKESSSSSSPQNSSSENVQEAKKSTANSSNSENIQEAEKLAVDSSKIKNEEKIQFLKTEFDKAYQLKERIQKIIGQLGRSTLEEDSLIYAISQVALLLSGKSVFDQVGYYVSLKNSTNFSLLDYRTFSNAENTCDNLSYYMKTLNQDLTADGNIIQYMMGYLKDAQNFFYGGEVVVDPSKINYAEAYKYNSCGKKIILSYLSITGPNTELEKLLSGFNQLEPLLQEKLNKLYSSTFHANNTGKVFFSNTPFVVGEESSQQKNQLSLTDSIYAIAFFDQNISCTGYNTTPPAFELSLELNGVNMGKLFSKCSATEYGKIKNQAYYTFTLYPFKDSKKYDKDLVKLLRALSNTIPKQYTTKVSADFVSCNGPNVVLMANGSFQFDCSGIESQRSTITALADKIEEYEWANTIPPKDIYKNAIIQAKILAALKAEGINAKRIILDQPDYKKGYSNYGGDLSYLDNKYMDFYYITEEEGKCYLIYDKEFIIEYVSDGKYDEQNPYFSSVPYPEKKRIKCENVFK